MNYDYDDLLLNSDQFNMLSYQHHYKTQHYAVLVQRCCWAMSAGEHHVTYINFFEN